MAAATSKRLDLIFHGSVETIKSAGQHSAHQFPLRFEAVLKTTFADPGAFGDVGKRECSDTAFANEVFRLIQNRFFIDGLLTSQGTLLSFRPDGRKYCRRMAALIKEYKK